MKWTDNTAVRVPTGDHRVLLNGKPPPTGVRVLSEGNYQLALHCVNAHDDLVAACEALTSAVDEWQCEDPDSPHLDPIRRSLTLGLAAIAKAKEVKPF